MLERLTTNLPAEVTMCKIHKQNKRLNFVWGILLHHWGQLRSADVPPQGKHSPGFALWKQ